MADPYVVTNPGTTWATTTLNLTVTRATAAGDHIIVSTVLSGSGGVASVTDSRGNTYTLQESDTPGNGIPTYTYLADGATTALQVGDTITITYGLIYSLKTGVAIAIPGTAATSLDQKNVADSAGSPSPSVTSPTLTQASEVVIGIIGSAPASGDPAWAAGWTKLTSATTSTGNWISLAYKRVNSTAAVTANAGISSAKWTAQIVTLKTSSTITITSPALPNGFLGGAYAAPQETATGGTGTYTWAKTAGTLPPGISISSSGVWSGMPTSTGTFTFTIQATDGNALTASQSQTIIVNPAVTPGGPYLVGSSSANSGGSTTLTVPVQNPVAQGDSILVGVLVATTGVTVSVSDTAGNSYSETVGNTTQAGAQLHVFECDQASVLTAGVDTISVVYSANTSVQGAIAVGDSNVFALDKFVTGSGSSTAPSSGSSGTLSQAEEHAIAFIADAAAGGVPAWAAPWSSNVVANVQGGAGARLSAAFQVVNATTALTASGTIATAAWSAAEVTTRVNPVISTFIMSNGVQGEAYSQTLEASGGVGPYTWSVSAGTLPAGLSLASGVVSGTPSVNGAFSFTLRTTDSHSVTYDLPQTITILPGGASGAPVTLLPNNLLTPADSTGESAGTWAADVNASAPFQNTAIALAGTKSTSWTSLNDGLTQISTDFYNVQPNQSYIASGFMLPPGARHCQIGIKWYTSGNTLIRQDLGTVTVVPGTAWNPVTFAGTSPATAAKCKLVAVVQESNKGDVNRIELMYLAQSDVQVLVDWINPVFAASSQAGSDFMDVSMWVRMDTGISMTRGRQDSSSDVQASSASFTLQNDTGIFTKGKSTSIVALTGGNMTLSRRYQINVSDEFGVWNTRADGIVSDGSYSFTNNGLASSVATSGSDVITFMGRKDALASWTEETVRMASPLYHWDLDDPGNAAGSGLAAETSGNNGPALRVWNTDNTRTATIAWGDTSGGVETLANAAAPGKPDGGEFWQPGSSQPTSALRGLDAGVMGPFTTPQSAIYLVPKLTAQTQVNWFTGNIGYQLQTALPTVINPATSDYSFEMWFTMDPGIKTNIASKFGPYVPLSLGNSVDGTTLVAGIFLTGASPHSFKINTYSQPPAFLGKNFPGNGPPATTQSISQNLTADSVPLPHHLVIVITGGTSPLVTAYLDGVQFGSTFSLPAGQRYDNIVLGGTYGGMGCHWGAISLASVYNRALSSSEITTHCQMGQYGMWEQTTDDCIATLAEFANTPGFWTSLSGNHNGLSLTDYQDISGTSALASMQTYAKAENGLLFVDASGKLTFHTRDRRLGRTAPDLLLGPDTFDGSQMGWTVSDQFLSNEFGVSSQTFQTGAGFINKPSQENYGIYTANSVHSPLQLPLITWSRAFGSSGLTSFYYFSDPNLEDRAAWEANSRSEPWMLPASITVDLLTLNKVSTGLGISNFYALEIDSLIAPTGTLPASFPDTNTSKEWFIEGISETITDQSHTIVLNCSPAETQRAWIPGDSTYGVLGTTSRIGISQADQGPEVSLGKNTSHDAGRPYWPPQFGSTMNNPASDGHGFIGGLDIRGITDNLSLLTSPPMLVVGAVNQAQSFPSGSNSTPQVFWDNIYVDTENGMGLMPGWPNWYVVTVPGFYDIDVSFVSAAATVNAGFAVSGQIVVAAGAAQGLAAGTVNPVTNGSYVTPEGEQVRINVVTINPVACPTVRMYLGLGDMVTVASQQSSGASRNSGVGLGGSKFSLLWRGWSQTDDRVQFNSLITGGTVTNAKVTTTTTKTYQNTHTYAYFGKQNNPPWNRRNSDLNAYQGLPEPNNPNGSESTQIVFPYSQINADLNPGGGATVAIKSVKLTGTNITGGAGNGARGLFGYSTQTPGGGTFDATSVTNRDVTQQWFNVGKSATFTLPASFGTSFQGSGKFILLGNGSTTHTDEYGSWKGGPGSWQLQITYTVSV
jgi:hypothetical protein